MKTLKKIYLPFIFLILSSESLFSQFFIISGDSAQSLARNFINKNALDLDKIKPEFLEPSLKYDSLGKDEYVLPFTILKTNIELKTFQRLTAAEGKNILIKQVGIKEASRVNIQFDEFVLNDEDELYFISSSLNEFAGPVRKQDFYKKQAYLNTGMMEGRSVYVILINGRSSENLLENKLKISEVWYSVAEAKARLLSGTPPNSVCYPAYEEASLAVGRILMGSIGGSNCSFTLMNNEANNRIPYGLSARHCVATNVFDLNLEQSDKNKLSNAIIEMPYKLPNCDGSGTPIVRYQTTGATYLDSQWPSDHLLFQINDVLPLGINYWGWDRNPGTPFNCVGIHHPGGNEQKISFGSAGNDPFYTHKYGAVWDIGSTSGGSSGSGLLSPSGKVTGSLSLGFFGSDKYSKLSYAWQTDVGGVKGYLSPNQNLSSMNSLIPLLMTGPILLCYGQSGTINMPNLLSGEGVTWSVSAGLNIASYTGNSVIVTPNSPTSSGIVTVTATYFNANRNSNETKNYQFQVGPPIVTGLSLSNITTGSSAQSGGTIALSTSQSNSLQLSHAQWSLTGANWVFPSGWSTGTNGYTYNTIYSWSGGYGVVTVFPKNSCGTSQYPAVFNISGVSLTSPVVVFPNVASDDLNFSFNVSDKSEFNIPDEVIILNSVTSTIQKKIELTALEKKIILNNSGVYQMRTNGLSPGSYIVNLIFSDKSKNESKKIIIQR